MEQEKDTAVARAESGPITVKVKDRSALAREPRESIWMGVTRDAPFQNFRIGAHTFQMYGEAVQVIDEGDHAGEVQGNPQRGRLGDVAASERELIVSMIPRYWVKRHREAKRGCIFFFEGSPTGVPDEAGIEPLGRYLYMIPADHMKPGDMRPEGEPPTMVPRS